MNSNIGNHSAYWTSKSLAPTKYKLTEIGNICIMNVQNNYVSSWSVLILVINITYSHVTPYVERDICVKFRVYRIVYTHEQCSVWLKGKFLNTLILFISNTWIFRKTVCIYYYYYYYLFIYLNWNWVDTRWQQYSTHSHTNSTQNTESGTYVTTKTKKI
jgi:hypothetical protein